MASSFPHLLSAYYDYELDNKTTINYYSIRDYGLLDDLEMEFVAKLVTQQEDQQLKNDLKNDHLQQHQLQQQQYQQNPLPLDINSPKENRKGASKKWKSWGWKYSPGGGGGGGIGGSGGGKNSSIEEEPESPKKSLSSKHSSPSESPKHRPLRDIDNTSPLRRIKTPSPHNSPSKQRNEQIRSSAGARLYQIIDGIDIDDDNEELQALISSSPNGRPASIHVLQSSSAGHLQY